MNSQGVTKAEVELRARRFRVREDGTKEWLDDERVISTSQHEESAARRLYEQVKQSLGKDR